MMKSASGRVLAFAAFVCLWPGLSKAQAPHAIAFQGRLTNAAGAALPDGNRTVTFRLYNGREGTFQVTGEGHTFNSDTVKLVHAPVVANSETVTKSDGSATYARGTAYTIDNAAGVITRIDTSILPDGTRIRVSYNYTAATLWEETKPVIVRKGLISTALGDTTPFPTSLSFDQPLYLGVQVGADPEMIPRTELSGAPYALSLALPYSAGSTADWPGRTFSVTNSGSGTAIYALQGPPSGLSSLGSGIWGDSQVTGVLGTAGTGEGILGLSSSGAGVYGFSTSGPGVFGVTTNAGFGAHRAGVEGACTPDNGVGVFAGDMTPYGSAGFQTHYSTPSTHIWCAENNVRVFSVTGGGLAYMTGCNLCSDGRLKKDIQNLRDPLASVLAMRGVSFQWNPNSAPPSLPKGRQIGFVAQEVEKVLPEVVHTDQDGLKSVAYQNIVPVLVEALKAQQKEIADLRRKAANTALLEARLRRLEEAAGNHRALPRSARGRSSQ